MNLEINNIQIEKNLFFSFGFSCLFYFRKNKNFGLEIVKNLSEQNFFRHMKDINVVYTDREQFGFKIFDFYTFPNTNNNLRYFDNCENCNEFSNLEYDKSLDHYINVDIKNSLTTKKRTRRKFSTDDERRLARILKNRRTAEESRQRRILKMRQLENFVIISEEKEKKLREEIRVLGRENASHIVELFLLKKKQ